MKKRIHKFIIYIKYGFIVWPILVPTSIIAGFILLGGTNIDLIYKYVTDEYNKEIDNIDKLS